MRLSAIWMARPWWWSVYPRDTPTVIIKEVSVYLENACSTPHERHLATCHESSFGHRLYFRYIQPFKDNNETLKMCFMCLEFPLNGMCWLRAKFMFAIFLGIGVIHWSLGCVHFKVSIYVNLQGCVVATTTKHRYFMCKQYCLFTSLTSLYPAFDYDHRY